MGRVVSAALENAAARMAARCEHLSFWSPPAFTFQESRSKAQVLASRGIRLNSRDFRVNSPTIPPDNAMEVAACAHVTPRHARGASNASYEDPASNMQDDDNA